MARKKSLSPEKAAAEISAMLADGTAKDAKDAVKQRSELKSGLEYFEEASKQPVSRGSGPALLDRDW